VSHAGTWVPFGPKTYTRGTGTPVTVTDTFTLLNPATTYTLKVFNGGLQNDPTDQDLVSNSVVFLNGVQIVGSANFNQSVIELDVPITPELTNTLSVQVRGKPGGVLAIEIVGVDNDPPTITASVSPSPNAAGWNNSPVTVTFTCSDKTSGVASCPAPVTVSTEGANQVVSGTATDLAGNTASTSVTINLDMTPPTITGTINPPPDAGGYNSGPVTVTFTCADALSGVATCPAPVQVTTEGAGQVISGIGTDIAGNTASITVTVNISSNYFKIRTWQTGPNGNASKPNGMCLDYGPPDPMTGATVFLNDCDKANPIRIWTIPDRMIAGTTSYEVLLFAGKLVIGIHNPNPISVGGATSTSTSSSPSSSYPPTAQYALELQDPYTSSTTANQGSIPANQIWRLDGDSIILEGSYAQSGLVHQGPCINTITTIPPLCPDPSPQLVVQVQSAHGAIGSPLVADVRNLADNEFWDFVATDGSGKYPTGGFMSVSTNVDLWNKTCMVPQVAGDPPLVNGTPLATFLLNNGLSGCYTSAPGFGWGSVIVIAGSDPNECRSDSGVGPCLDLSGYPPLQIPAGVTVRGNRRGTSFGPQLYGGYSRQSVIFEIEADYSRVTGVRLRGQSRSTDGLPFKTNAIWIDYVGKESAPGGAPPQIPLFPLVTVTELIATIDHNDMSDWMDAAITVDAPFNVSAAKSTRCSYNGYVDSAASPKDTYTCDPNTMRSVPYSPGLVSANPNLSPVTIANEAGTLANVRVSRNFLHHNERNGGGYGVGMNNAGSRLLIDANTFSWNRHHITASGEPHSEYRALNNLVLSGAPTYNSNPISILGRLQDFDMHGTDNIDYCVIQLTFSCIGAYFGGAGGYFVEIAGNTFLGTDGHDYNLRGFPILNTSYHNNVSRRNENDAIKFTHCNPFDTSGCINDYTNTPFSVDISNSQFADSSPPYTDPTARLGVGDFDGDGDDDLFMATGAGWYYSPGGQREWRYLNSAPDTIDQLLLGDFDGDGRTDVVGMRNGQLFVSWGGISAFELLNGSVPANCTIADMAVGDFNGDGIADIFCADYRNNDNTWWVWFGGNPANTAFVKVATSSFTRQALRFGHFSICGGGQETDVFSVQSNGWQVSCGATVGWQPLGMPNPTSVDGLVVADFRGSGAVDVGSPCSSGGVLGAGASPGWQISYGGTQGWSTCTAFAGPLNSANCGLIFSALPSLSPCIALANGAVGRFSGGPGADLLLWTYYNTQLAATLWDFPGGAGTPYQLSAQDVDMH